MLFFLSKSVNKIRERYSVIAFHPMDYTIIGYAAVLGLLIIPFHNDVPRWPLYPVFHSVFILLLLEFLRFAEKNPSKVIHFFRTFYPGFLLGLMWSELDNLITMMFPYWANEMVVGLDKWIFGVHPTVWLQRLYTPWLTELMNFFYCSYYFFIPVGGLSLYLKGRQREAFGFLFLTFFPYCISFLLFLFFPAEGPWVILKGLHTVEPKGFLFQNLNEYMQGGGSIRGGCFPSSHVAGAFAMAWATLKYQPRLGIIFMIFAIGINLATVYCTYHHAVDGIAGMLLGTILYVLGTVILIKWEAKRSKPLKQS